LAMSSLSAYPCTQADKAQLSTNHRSRRFRNSSWKVRRAVRIDRSSNWLIIYPPCAKDSSISLGHIADDTYRRPVARSKITTPRPPNCVFLHSSVYTSSQGVSSASRRQVSTGERVKSLRKKSKECVRASFHASCPVESCFLDKIGWVTSRPIDPWAPRRRNPSLPSRTSVWCGVMATDPPAAGSHWSIRSRIFPTRSSLG
jgi:hypothetical protein